MESDFYKEFVAADEEEDMKAVCKKYNKDYKIAKQALIAATKIDMASTNTSKEVYHARIIEWLRKKGL